MCTQGGWTVKGEKGNLEELVSEIVTRDDQALDKTQTCNGNTKDRRTAKGKVTPV